MIDLHCRTASGVADDYYAMGGKMRIYERRYGFSPVSDG
jgi:hypothetical protein